LLTRTTKNQHGLQPDGEKPGGQLRSVALIELYTDEDHIKITSADKVRCVVMLYRLI